MTNETDVLMPAPITYAQSVRYSVRLKCVKWHPAMVAKPGCKKAVSLPVRTTAKSSVSTPWFSTQHAEDIDLKKSLQEAVMEEIKPILPSEWLNTTKFFINPTGRFVIGGPMGDCGLTGRKIIVDTYGGMASVTAARFSGVKIRLVDRSGSLRCACWRREKHRGASGRIAVKSVPLRYRRVAEPTSIMVETFGTEKCLPTVDSLVREFFDLRPYGLIQMLICCTRFTKKLRLTATSVAKLPMENRQSANSLRDAAGLEIIARA